MRKIGMEIKIILFVVVFTLLITGLERYQFSENIITQFKNSKKAKNRLLLNTILPVLSLDLSLGLNNASREYLRLIVQQNKDIKFMLITNNTKKTIFRYPDNAQLPLKSDVFDTTSITESSSSILDNITGEKIGHIFIEFYDNDYEEVLSKNEDTTIRIFAVTFLLLGMLVYFINLEFRHLRKLTKAVLLYNPKLNNFPLTTSKRYDEVGIIHNAIITMVERIHEYTNTVRELNMTLEDRIKQRTKELEEANQKLKILSTIDPLTNVGNRRHFEKWMENIWQLAMRTDTTVSLIMCDIDYFKRVNDTYGHVIGDEVLKNIANAISDVLKRPTDLVARYGGEEFIIGLYGTDTKGAKALCDIIMNNLKNPNNFKIGELEIEPYTMSFGISSMIPTKEHKYTDLLTLADQALYHAKDNGRNCIVIFNNSDLNLP